jgi:enoyl-CoA hydratase/carnithine racemase
MKDKILIKEMDGDVAILKLNRPGHANALNRDLFVALKEELDDLQWADGVKVVIITGEGQKTFCAGIDLKERAQKGKEEILLERETVIRPFYVTLGNFSKPCIAVLNGYALGGGAELALTCDLRVASTGARFGHTEIRWGMIPSCGACQRLRLLVGMGIAKDIILTGRVLEAEEAYRLGIYNRLVPEKKLLEEALGLAKKIAAHPPIAVRQAKKALDAGADIASALDFDFEASKECFLAGDALAKPKKF